MVTNGGEDAGDSAMRRYGSRRGPESALFSPPSKNREQELERAIGKKTMNFMAFRDLANGGVALKDLAGPSSGIRDSEGMLTNQLLEKVAAEMTEIKAQNSALLAEIQKTNRLLAFTISKPGGYSYNHFPKTMVDMLKEKSKVNEAILNNI